MKYLEELEDLTPHNLAEIHERLLQRIFSITDNRQKKQECDEVKVVIDIDQAKSIICVAEQTAEVDHDPTLATEIVHKNTYI